MFEFERTDQDPGVRERARPVQKISETHIGRPPPFLPLPLAPHDTARDAVGALPVVRGVLRQLRTDALLVVHEVAGRAAEQFARLVANLAVVVVLVEEVLLVGADYDRAGRVEVGRGVGGVVIVLRIGGTREIGPFEGESG